MTTVRAFDPYERSKRLHPSAQPAPVAEERDAEIIPFPIRPEPATAVEATR